MASSVRSVRVTPEDDGAMRSDWEVNFRNGILKWQEIDRVDREARTMTFVQTEGDLAEFSGEWRVEADDDDATIIHFRAEFDLGIPSLATMLDPVAERALRSNISELITAFASPQVAVFPEPSAAA
ncbi:MAG TPA: SRPBCC family protein [Thermoleophilaceae bacterium]|nr:SRPBCC family protein [Thermoleophilaceae bacterium]